MTEIPCKNYRSPKDSFGCCHKNTYKLICSDDPAQKIKNQIKKKINNKNIQEKLMKLSLNKSTKKYKYHKNQQEQQS